MSGSSVNPYTPCPTVYTSMVLEPYRRYPAATCSVPRRNNSSSVGKRSALPYLRTEKIAPSGILLSVLEEPSSGSNNNMYLPCGQLPGIEIGFSISSEAKAQTYPLC